MELNQDLFRETVNGKQTSLHLLQNKNGMKVPVTNYGARFVSMIVKDRDGRDTDVVVGFDSIQGYLNSTEPFYSALVGRYANRIAKGQFVLEGKPYQLAINNGPNHLHGGPNGFHNQVWTIEAASERFIRLSYFSPDGEENFPGNLRVSVIYTLTDENELSIDYEAGTDQTTIINLTSHPFFNLNGQGSGSIEDHLLMINADQYTPVDETLIPTGLAPVDDSPFDFRMPMPIGSRIDEDHEQLKYGGGYDHNFVLNGEGFRSVALAKGERSDIVLEVLTDQPGLQLYSGNFMKAENRIKYGMTDKKREAFCLETQHFPDSPNHPEFPSTIIRPGDVFRSRTVYRFYVERT